MKKILLVEDSPGTVEVMQLELKLLGYESVLVAKDGNEAVQMAAVNAPDLIIMDISLPKVDGIQATTIIRNNPVTQSIRILAATARAEPSDRQQCLEAGCDDYIAKPFTYQQLGAAIKRLLP
jgi:CheY-like chemotaxis protein